MSTKKKLTDIASAAEIASQDIMHLVDVSDTTQTADGSSKKVTLEQIREFILADLPTTGGEWGEIEGDLEDQTDLQEALDAKADQTDLNTHIADHANPHAVTKAQVGLGNVDNTSDVNKPVSAAQQAALDLKISLSEKGANNGVATLDAGGKIPASQLPNTVMEFKGTWNANTNTPALADGSGNAGDVYLVTVAAIRDLGSGAINFAVGDWAVYNGTIWQKSINSNAVVSVNGQQGVVSLTTTHIPEGTNLYFTQARARDSVLGTYTVTFGTITGADTIHTAIEKLAGAIEEVPTIYSQDGTIVNDRIVHGGNNSLIFKEFSSDGFRIEGQGDNNFFEIMSGDGNTSSNRTFRSVQDNGDDGYGRTYETFDAEEGWSLSAVSGSESQYSYFNVRQYGVTLTTNQEFIVNASTKVYGPDSDNYVEMMSNGGGYGRFHVATRDNGGDEFGYAEMYLDPENAFFVRVGNDDNSLSTYMYMDKDTGLEINLDGADSKRVIINSGYENISGLRLQQMTSSTPTSPGYNLGYDDNGDVIRVAPTIQIPQLSVSVIAGTQARNKRGISVEDAEISENPVQVAVHWKATDKTFLQYNPKIFLFRYKPKAKKASSPDPMKQSGFVHPVHMNGLGRGGKYFAGTSTVGDRETEWDCPTIAFLRQRISIDPKVYRGTSGSFASECFPIKIQDYESNAALSMITPRKKYGEKSVNKTIPLKFAIVIDNPDPNTQGEMPYLVGPESEVVCVLPKLEIFAEGAYFTSWKGLLGNPAKGH